MRVWSWFSMESLLQKPTASIAETPKPSPPFKPQFKSSTLSSLSRILSLNLHGDDSHVSNSSNSSFSWSWAPIDFATSSIGCPKRLAILLGRSFTSVNYESLERPPPPCAVDTNGCICRWSPNLVSSSQHSIREKDNGDQLLDSVADPTTHGEGDDPKEPTEGDLCSSAVEEKIAELRELLHGSEALDELEDGEIMDEVNSSIPSQSLPSRIDDEVSKSVSSDRNHFAELPECHSNELDNGAQKESPILHYSNDVNDCDMEKLLIVEDPEQPLQEQATYDISQDKVSGHVSQDIDIRTAKNKRGPITVEAKAKKKMKKKRKRAEMNKKLGVKRLRIVPVAVQKPKIICRYYLHGRCQQGDDCKFSHDAVPLTKSQPCSYFATQRCLKGDACPFDHDLSKYPCNKFTTSGFCHRGDQCRFSHKLPPKDTPTDRQTNNITNSQLEKGKSKAPTALAVTNVSKGESPSFPMKELTIAKSSKPPLKMPEGISFLSFAKSPKAADESQKLQQLTSPFSIENNIAPVLNKKIHVAEQSPQSSTPSTVNYQGTYSNSVPQLSKSLSKGLGSSPSSAQKAIANMLAFTNKYQSEISRGTVRLPFSDAGIATGYSNSSSIDPSNGTESVPKSATMILEEFLFGGSGNK